jgi:hypothetical protein
VADARQKLEAVEVMVPKMETRPAGVTLELDDDEAKLFADMLGKIGGEPGGRRRYAAAMEEAMRSAGYVFDSGRIDETFVGGKGITLK